ncbi:MAG: FAD:protein FMN transferase [Spirochaetota bacterium]
MKLAFKIIEKKLRIVYWALPGILILTLISCAPKLTAISTTRIALGTYIKITIVVDHGRASIAQDAIEKAYTMIESYEKIFDYRVEDGALAIFNDKTVLEEGDEKVLLSLIKEALQYANLTNGYFDPTILPLVKLWGFDSKSPRLPSPEEITRTLQFVGYENALTSVDGVKKPEWLKFDLSGIAKGKIVDLIRDSLKEQGYKNFLIDAGGDIYVSGLNSRRKKWRIAIQDPEHMERFSGVVEKTDTAIVTSGDYENYFEEGGRIYSHLLDPHTGYPNSDCKSVTILASDTGFADAIATGVFVMGSQRGSKFLIENKVEGFIIYKTVDGKIKTYSTSGFWK